MTIERTVRSQIAPAEKRLVLVDPSTSLSSAEFGPAPAEQRRRLQVAERVVALMDGIDINNALEFQAEALAIAREWEVEFHKSGLAAPTPEDEARFDQMFGSQSVREAFSELAEIVIQVLQAGSLAGNPGHDLRHILIKDPTDALAFSIEEGLQGFRRTFVLPALLHDIGLIPDAWMSFKKESGILGKDHPVLGFYLVKQLYDLFDRKGSSIPLELRDQHLYAILAHQRGKANGNFIAEAVMRADREQLVGAEGIERMIAHDVHFTGCALSTTIDGQRSEGSFPRAIQLPAPGTAEDTDLMHHIEFYARNLYPQIGSQGERRANERKAISGKFLWLASAPDARRQIFAPEEKGQAAVQEGHWSKKPFSQEVWNMIQREPSLETRQRMEYLKERYGVEALLFLMVTPTLAANPDAPTPSEIVFRSHSGRTVWETLRSELQALTEPEAVALKEGLAYAITKREEQEKVDLSVLTRVLELYPDAREVEAQVAQAILRNWNKLTHDSVSG